MVHIIVSNGREPPRRDSRAPAGVKCRRILGGARRRRHAYQVTIIWCWMPGSSQMLILVVPAYRMGAC